MYEEFNEKIARIGVAKDNIKTSLTNKGLAPSDNIEDYAALIDSIEQGSGSANIKLFESEAEMYADTNANIGDLALVYKENSEPLKNGDKVQVIKFPQTVVLDTAITTTQSGQVMGYENDIYLNLMVYYSPTEVAIQSMEGSPNIEYTSADGITYTKTTGDDIYDLGGYVTVDDFEELLDILGPFMLLTTYHQGGVYKYDSYLDEEYVKLVTLPSRELTETFSIPSMFREKHYGGNQASLIVKTYHYDAGRKLNIIDTCDFIPATGPFTYNGRFMIDSSTNKCYLETSNTSSALAKVQHYDFSLDNPLVSEEDITTTATFAGTTYTIYELPNPCYVYADNGAWNTNVQIANYNGSSFGTTYTIDQSPQAVSLYKLAGNQFSLVNANQLLPSISAYGKTGVIEGDGSIYDNLDMNMITSEYFGLTPDGTNFYKGIPRDKFFINHGKMSTFGKLNYYKTSKYESNTINNQNLLAFPYKSVVTSEHLSELMGARQTNSYLMYNTDKSRIIMGSSDFWIDAGNDSYIGSTTAKSIRIIDAKTGEVLHTQEYYTAIGMSRTGIYYCKTRIDSSNFQTDVPIYRLDVDTLEETTIGNYPKIGTDYAWGTSPNVYVHHCGKHVVVMRGAHKNTSTYRSGINASIINLETGTLTNLGYYSHTQTNSLDNEYLNTINIKGYIMVIYQCCSTYYYFLYDKATSTSQYLYMYHGASNSAGTWYSFGDGKYTGYKSGNYIYSFPSSVNNTTIYRYNLGSTSTAPTSFTLSASWTAPWMTSASAFNISLNYEDEYIGRSTYSDNGYTFPITFSNATSSSLTVTPGNKIMKINGYIWLSGVGSKNLGAPADSWVNARCSNLIVDLSADTPTIEYICGPILGKISPEYYTPSDITDFDIICIEGYNSSSYNYLMTLYTKQQLTEKEYDTAVDTAVEILGEEV